MKTIKEILEEINSKGTPAMVNTDTVGAEIPINDPVDSKGEPAHDGVDWKGESVSGGSLNTPTLTVTDRAGRDSMPSLAELEPSPKGAPYESGSTSDTEGSRSRHVPCKDPPWASTYKRRWPWWAPFALAGGLFVTGLLTTRPPTPSSQEAIRAGAPDLAAPVSSLPPRTAPEPPTGVSNHPPLWMRLPQLRRLVETGRLRPQEIISAG